MILFNLGNPQFSDYHLEHGEVEWNSKCKNIIMMAIKSNFTM